MNSKLGSMLMQSFGGRMVSVIPGPLLLFAPGFSAAQYDGAETCGNSSCHQEKYAEWLTSGHHMMLMEGQNAKNRAVPLPDGQDWDDISYVVGGHRNKALYLDDEGYIFAPNRGDNQYNLLTGEWSDYHAGETLTYNCASCHTTGYEAGGSPADLPGIEGTFALPGVQCEHCHGGPGEMEQADTDRSFCGTCHHNNADDGTISAANGFIKSEGQYNEFLAGAHTSSSCEANSNCPSDCIDCHNPHKGAQAGIKVECVDCHTDIAALFAETSMADFGVECKDCHMPYATLSAQPLGAHQGDTRTHIFSIDTDPDAEMFTPDGSAVRMSGGEAKVTMDFACRRCHETATLNELARFADDFHNPDKDFGNFGIDAGLTGTWYDPERAGEGWLFEVGYIGGALYMFASFYTYDTAGNQTYLLAESTAFDGATVEVVVYRTDGAMWGDDFVPGDVTRPLWGTGTFTFTSCTAGEFDLKANDEMKALGFTDLTKDIVRLLDAGFDCPTFVNNAN